ncbi:hypothetical protein, variant [Microbotryum lychnidis-dioicae p1A1 Lamole]|uniref:Raptor N-terminal CASPase-like domain-containing protein n=1 Tax=Microbotryum lychnidis-dioicae (strain p1A1 Lamole / MvSl-1064) TaxID=683840 RepID=U5GZZ3_USTV1|nr:hypothetical protein MVLG_00737 [Microbotryum lychnidis-dioicae p1A1 Lamole]KDE09016.1 hypothetical protein, variant [Microbotryum lychnidis-dioicae p1A1 Lamole]|eukprot:KDE09015.1 hypothetical protein MVLG_00737 [Microbotryum lychnidis-dioicae p1A1 Lamole]
MAPLQLTPIKASTSATPPDEYEPSQDRQAEDYQDDDDDYDSQDDEDDDGLNRDPDYDDGPLQSYAHVQRGQAQGASDSIMRHGFAEAYSSEEYLTALEKSYFLYWTETRHERAGLTKPPSSNPADHKIDWRNRDRIRTAAAVLVVCLRIGYDPPDVIKTDPCAKLECWVDPHALAKDKAMERIGKNLQSQFENLAATPKTRYKQYLDPPIEDAKKFCTAARKTAKNERVLFYYNGHGVPKPTPSGELWLFNKQYTQYIPVSLSEIVAWLGSPTIFVWDCSAASNIVTKVQEFAIKRDAELAKEAAAAVAAANGHPQTPAADGSFPVPEAKPQIPTVPFRDTIQLGACLAHETLPMNPDLPADLFTSCLTSPIEIALRFFLLRNPLKMGQLDLDMLLKVPGKVNDRRTPLGELNWIFTAVTDTIAWNSLPRDLFQKLFRHDLVVAALFRGFLLAERIMRFYECTPISVPALPQTHNHPLWDSWDLAVDMCLAQLPKLLDHEKRWLDSLPPHPLMMPDQAAPPQPPGPLLPYEHSNFFSEQLTAFQVWLDQGAVSKRRHPEQLPVVLQVLLSQAHRLRALILLCRFIDLGPWAVNVALSIGIFAYVLRLLQAPASELRPVLIYIWARILAVYENCKEDLLKQTYPPTRTADLSPYTYFVNILHPSTNSQLPVSNVSEHRAMCAFILSVCCRGHKPGQVACLKSNVFEACLVHLHDQDGLLRQWAALCIAQIWDDFEEAKGLGVRTRVHELFCSLLNNDPIPEVRASVLYALGTLLGTTGSSDPNKKFGRSIAATGPACGLSPEEANDIELGVAMATLKSSTDGSPLVRRELIALLSSIVNEHPGQFIIAAYRALMERATKAAHAANASSSPPIGGLGPANASSTIGRASSTSPPAREDPTSAIASSINATAESLIEGPKSPKFRAVMFSCMYKTIFDLTADPQPDIAALAQTVMDHIIDLVFVSPLGPSARLALRSAPSSALRASIDPAPPAGSVLRDQLHSSDPGSSSMTPRSNGHVTPGLGGTMKRATTTAMKSLAHLTSSTLTEQATTNQPPPPPSALRLNGRSASTGGGSGSVAASPTGSASPLHSSASTDSLRYLQSRAGGKASSKKALIPTTDSATIEGIMIELVAADEERLRRRRAAPTLSEGEPDQVFPLKGLVYEYALEYYKESQMKTTESEEPGSVQHNERMWRRQRNEAVILKTQPMKTAASRARWDSQIGFYSNDTIPTRILFHQFESHLLAADDRGQITVYDWEKNLRINRFANGSPASVPITSLKFVNEDDVAMLLSGTADGHVRLFRNYASADNVELVSSFQGIAETIPTTTTQQDAGLVLEWQQGRGQLLMGGNVKLIRVWDATKEQAVQDLPTRANSCLTSLTGDQVAGNILAAGFGDGGMRIYDRRLSARDNMVRSYKGHHQSWLLNVHMQRGGDRELVSASLGGEACLWDIRLAEPIKRVQAHHGGMTQLAVHEHAPVFATSSAFNVIKLWSMKDMTEPISKFGNSFGFMNQRNISMTSVAFHPHHMMLGCAAGDGHLNLFEMEDYKSALTRVGEQQGPMARISWA